MSESNYIKAMWIFTVVVLLSTVLAIFLINKDKQEVNINKKVSVSHSEPSYYNINTLALKRQWCSLVEPCRVLAEVGYYESRGESDMGVVAVMQVVMNRVDSGGVFRNQNDIKSVVYKKHQFSYLLDGSMNNPMDYKQMDRMLVLAYDVMHRNVEDVTRGSTHYHANYVTPRWNKHYKYVTTIGNHIFYK